MTVLLRLLRRFMFECRVAPLTPLIFAGLNGWEAIETIHLGTAGVFSIQALAVVLLSPDPEEAALAVSEGEGGMRMMKNSARQKQWAYNSLSRRLKKEMFAKASASEGTLGSIELVDTVRSVLKQKGQEIWSVSPEALVYDAIEMMAEKHIGALLVIAENKLLASSPSVITREKSSCKENPQRKPKSWKS